MKFRLAKSGDEKQLLNLVQAVLGEYGLQLEPDEADLDITDIERFYLQNKGWFQVVEVEGKIIGSVGVYKLSDSVCELRKMYLDVRYQGRGIGKVLMENALIAAKRLGYKEITLQTNSVLAKALPLYKKYGFVEFKEEVCTRCDIAMKRQILEERIIEL